VRPSATQRAYEEIKGEVLSGSLRPGDQIVIEDLCARLEMSRTPVREALLALEREGLVRIVPRHGYFVSEISYRQALDAYQLRFFLEPIATAMAAQRVTPEELAELRTLADVPRDGSEESFIRAVEQNRAFHVRIAEISGNRRLAKTMADLLDDMKRLTYVELRTEHTEADWQEEHEHIVGALERRDPKLAARAVRATFYHDAGLLPSRARAELSRLLDEMDQPESTYGSSAEAGAG
jgi:GntR family transcriptional regulator, rspAB operon transcriptional repressor